MNEFSFLEFYRTRIHELIDKTLPSEKQYPSELHQALRYMSSDGKCFNSIATYLWGDLLKLPIELLDDAAIAMEFLHIASLIIDDLPEFDDDDFRRGKLSCHKKFSVPTAILTANNFIFLAFEHLFNLTNKIDSKNFMQIGKVFCHFSGSIGLSGGELLDLKLKDRKLNYHSIYKAFVGKTSCFGYLSLFLPSMIAGYNDKKFIFILKKHAFSLGVSFQIMNDIFDYRDFDLLGKENINEKQKNITNIINLIGIIEAKKIKDYYLKKSINIINKIIDIKNTNYEKFIYHIGNFESNIIRKEQ